ncbi:MAG: hypothetical protein ACR2P0_19040 [Acidimicrobiales bacterium]
MSSMYCFQCAREYVEEVEECVECGVPLVEDEPTPPELVGEENEPQVAYELYEWSFESRRMLDQLLTGQGISHGWQGAVVIVREADEDRADALVEQAEQADGPRLDPEVEKIGYAMDDWTADAQSALVDALGLAGIAHEFDAEGELVIAEDDEEAVDDLIDGVSQRLAIEDELGDAETVLEGLQLSDLLGEVRTLAQRLVKNPGDAKATISLVRQADALSDVRTPFGFDSRGWAAIRMGAANMGTVLATEERTEEDVVDAAGSLAEQLRDLA